MKPQQMAQAALLAAMCVVLGFLSIRIGNVIKITLEEVPVIFAALSFGPLAGVLVGGIGIFLYQLLSYGITATTVLWILPYVAAGFVCGWLSKSQTIKNDRRKLLLTILTSELLVTGLNTLAIFADAKIYGYYYPGIVTGVLLVRLAIALGKSVILAFLLPPLLSALERFTEGGRAA